MDRNGTSKHPTIARIWRGRVRPDRADEYEAYNYEAGIKPLIEKAMAVQTFREDRENETEFVTISYWENVEAMTAFTGGDPNQIHHLDQDAEFLIELPRRFRSFRSGCPTAWLGLGKPDADCFWRPAGNRKDHDITRGCGPLEGDLPSDRCYRAGAA